MFRTTLGVTIPPILQMNDQMQRGSVTGRGWSESVFGMQQPGFQACTLNILTIESLSGSSEYVLLISFYGCSEENHQGWEALSFISPLWLLHGW